nr:uncharacterized protein LOC106686685 [Halyomorpha halys]
MAELLYSFEEVMPSGRVRAAALKFTMLVQALGILLLHLVANASAMNCMPYQSACTLMTAANCCGFPFAVLCLPDNRGGTSCLSPLDVQSLSPVINSFDPAAPMLGQVESSVRQVQQVFNPNTDPLANPILDPIANPLLDPLANPLVDPLVNPILDPLVNPALNPTPATG